MNNREQYTFSELLNYLQQLDKRVKELEYNERVWHILIDAHINGEYETWKDVWTRLTKLEEKKC